MQDESIAIAVLNTLIGIGIKCNNCTRRNFSKEYYAFNVIIDKACRGGIKHALNKNPFNAINKRLQGLV
jgi:hypothetical protein